jgi:hypothetical protein
MEDETLMECFLNLDGRYSGDELWDRVRLRFNAAAKNEDESHIARSTIESRRRAEYLYSLGPLMETREERYFNLFGEHETDSFLPTYEEDSD